ncbi:MAG: hypothetical protein ABH816_03805 [Candidatus Levyibacteriota bacterium]
MSKEKKAGELARRIEEKRQESIREEVTKLLEKINQKICRMKQWRVDIEEAGVENVSVPEVILATDELTKEAFEELEVKHIPIVILSAPQERQQGPIKVFVTNDHPIDHFSVTNFDLSAHLPLVTSPICLTTAFKDYRYPENRYYSFFPIEGRMNPCLPYLPGVDGTNSASFQDPRDEESMTIIVIDARFPTSERDVTFFPAEVPRDAMETLSGVQFFRDR